MTDAKLKETLARVERGGHPKYHAKNAESGKLFARDRIAKLIDPGSFVEEAALANNRDNELPADGVVTGTATVGGRIVAIMANDSTVKAGSWGWRTVEKILRIQEVAADLRCPLFYLVDSAGARITDQVEMFPGRRGAGRIFYNEVRLSGRVPQVCLLFGPSAAGGAYIPAFCDVVIMREGNASMYLGSPRMAEMVIGEKVTLEEMGGAKMHTGVSGCGHFLVSSDEDGIELAKRYLSYFPENWQEQPPASPPAAPASERPIREIVPDDENKPFDVYELLDSLVDEGSFLEVQKRWAKELVVGYARIEGRVFAWNPASCRVLEKAGWTVADTDLFEVNPHLGIDNGRARGVVRRQRDWIGSCVNRFVRACRGPIDGPDGDDGIGRHPPPPQLRRRLDVDDARHAGPDDVRERRRGRVAPPDHAEFKSWRGGCDWAQQAFLVVEVANIGGHQRIAATFEEGRINGNPGRRVVLVPDF